MAFGKINARFKTFSNIIILKDVNPTHLLQSFDLILMRPNIVFNNSYINSIYRNKKNYPGGADAAAAVAAEFDPNGSMRGKKEQREESMKRLLEVGLAKYNCCTLERKLQ